MDSGEGTEGATDPKAHRTSSLVSSGNYHHWYSAGTQEDKSPRLRPESEESPMPREDLAELDSVTGHCATIPDNLFMPRWLISDINCWVILEMLSVIRELKKLCYFLCRRPRASNSADLAFESRV